MEHEGTNAIDIIFNNIYGMRTTQLQYHQMVCKKLNKIELSEDVSKKKMFIDVMFSISRMCNF